jgi:WD40 repeat protein
MSAVSHPFRGLARFDDTDADAALFFGRERDREIVAANLVASRLTVLYGASGVGKSSLLRAGVAHNLRRSPEPQIVVVFDAWQADPVERLKQAVAEAADVEPARTLADTLDDCATAVGGDVYVLLDQVDEYFLYHWAESGPGTFAEEFPAAVARSGLRASFLLALREETVARLDSFKSRIPNVLGNYLRLDHLDRVAGRAAILGPIEEVNRHASPDERLEIEPELVEEVLDEVAAGKLDLGESGKGAVKGAGEDGRIETPYLQVVMQRLWTSEREAGSRTLRLQTLRELGGAEQIVRDRLRGALDALSPEQQDITAALFNHLVTPSGAKIAHGPADLAEYAHIGESMLVPVLSRLADERILRPVGDGSGGERYEIFHDVLAEAALGWKRTHDVDRELERQQEQTSRRHRRLLAALVAAALLIAVMAAVTVFALTQRSNARSQARVAHARELAWQGASLLQVDPAKSLELGVESLNVARTGQGEDLLRKALVESRVRAILQSDGPVRTVSYSPDGKLLLTAGDDGRARIWRPGGGRPVAVLRHGGPITSAAFSPDGRLVLTTSEDGTARVWGVGGGLVATLRHGGPVTSGSFGPGGHVVLTTSSDGTARIWTPAGRQIRLIRHGRPVRRGSISPDGRFLVTISSDPSGKELRARVFALPSGRLVHELPAKGVTTASFDRSGKKLVTGGSDHTAAVWRVSTGRRLRLFADHQQAVTDALFGPKGRLVVTTSADGATRVWDVRTGQRLALMLGHANAVVDAVFSRDGRFLLTSSDDGTARIWEAGTGLVKSVLRGHADSVTAGAFSPDGSAVATASADGTARVWDSGTTDELQLFAAAQGSVWSAIPGPGGGLVLTAGDDGRARIFTAGGRLLRVLGHSGPSCLGVVKSQLAKPEPPRCAAVFSPDGRLIFTVGADRNVRIWRSTSGALVRRVGGVSGPLAISPKGRLLAALGTGGVLSIRDAATLRPERTLSQGAPFTAAAFSPDGRLAVTAGADHLARIWDLRTGSAIRVLRGHEDAFTHEDALTDVEFSRDGGLVVTASRDHQARVWNTATGAEVVELKGHFGPVFGASFSPNSRWVVTAGPTTAGFWEVASGRLLLYLHGHTGPLTSASFFPGGTRILTSSRDGTVRTYTCVACGGVDALLAAAKARLESVRRSAPP